MPRHRIKNWKQAQSYRERTATCPDCRHCAVQDPMLQKAFCLLGYSHPREDMFANNGTEESKRFWEFAEGREVSITGTCVAFTRRTR